MLSIPYYQNSHCRYQFTLLSILSSTFRLEAAPLILQGSFFSSTRINLQCLSTLLESHHYIHPTYKLKFLVCHTLHQVIPYVFIL